jgi:hypothetical protein
MPRTRTSYRPGEVAPGQIAGVQARLRIQRIRAGLASAELTLEQLLVGTPPDDLAAQISRLQLQRALLWVPGIGPRSCDQILGALRLAPATRLHDLTPKQRRAVLAAVAAYGPNTRKAA